MRPHGLACCSELPAALPGLRMPLCREELEREQGERWPVESTRSRARARGLAMPARRSVREGSRGRETVRQAKWSDRRPTTFRSRSWWPAAASRGASRRLPARHSFLRTRRDWPEWPERGHRVRARNRRRARGRAAHWRRPSMHVHPQLWRRPRRGHRAARTPASRRTANRAATRARARDCHQARVAATRRGANLWPAAGPQVLAAAFAIACCRGPGSSGGTWLRRSRAERS